MYITHTHTQENLTEVKKKNYILNLSSKKGPEWDGFTGAFIE